MAIYHQHQQHLQLQQKHQRQGTPSPLQTSLTFSHQQSQQSFHHQKDPLLEELKRKSEETVQREEEEVTIELIRENINGGAVNPTNGRITGSNSSNTSSSSSSKGGTVGEFLLRRRSSSSLADGIRGYVQLLSSSTETSSCKEKSSSSSTSSTPPPTSTLQQQQLLATKNSSDVSSLFSEPIEEETRCVVCNANFPNVWLLEQHAALQHANLGPNDEKPFICEQCGQSYRYRSAYAKHKEQNHRARLPADKLFTCDVCGMQFRYLKSFKKHRLNHALERLHGKRNKNSALMDQDIVTSSQEIMADEGTDLRINIKRENVDNEEPIAADEEEEQDNTVDSVGITLFNDANSSNSTIIAEPNISSSETIHSTNKRVSIV